METWELLRWWIDEFGSYIRTRFLPQLWLICALICAAIYLLSWRERPLEFATLVACAVSLVFEFRLWDDLCDREQDRYAAPQRVLCKTQRLHAFMAVVAFAAAANIAAVAALRPWWSLAIICVLHVLLGAWYLIRKHLGLGAVVNYHVVLMKYPAFMLALGAKEESDFSALLYAATAIAYLGTCVLEVLHDNDLRRLRAARICLTVETFLLGVGVAVWVGVSSGVLFTAESV